MFLFKNALGTTTGVNVYKCLLTSYRQNLPFYNPCAGFKTLEEKVGLPPRPKKPLTPYFRFMKEMRPSVMKENPEAKLLDIVKIVAKKWGELDEAAKKKLREEFKKDQIAYVETRAKYDSKISPEQKSEIKQLRKDKIVAKEKREIKKKVRELGRPKRPLTAYMKFMVEERKLTPLDHSLPYKEWNTKIVEKWTRLSDEQKEPYVRDSKKEFEKYKQDMSKWEEKMVRLGHIDVVRNQSLIDPPPPKSKRSTPKSE